MATIMRQTVVVFAPSACASRVRASRLGVSANDDLIGFQGGFAAHLVFQKFL